MMDEQIIKALHLCANNNGSCRECPLYSTYSANCIKKLMNNTLDLVERQQEMIEAIINGQETLSKALVKKDAEIERLEAEKDNLIRTYKACMTDAITEFAEKIKERKYQSSDWSHGEHPYVVEEDDIDNLLWVLTEESNGTD